MKLRNCIECHEPIEPSKLKFVIQRNGYHAPMHEDCMVICPECGAVEGTSEWGTVGDGFDGYCPDCADEREASGEVELG